MIGFALQLAGAVALLIWAVRLIRTGVERAFRAQLRSALKAAELSRTLAAASGTVAAVLLQSSTAVALMAAGFAVSGWLALPSGIAILVGADLGSAIAAQILLVRAVWVVPLLILAGAVLFLRGQRRQIRQTGRILIGFGLVFVSLDMFREATAPLGGIPVLATIMSYLNADLVSAFALGAVLAYVFHSSLAMVLMIVSLVAGGLVSIFAGAALVLGANLGGALVPLVLTHAMPVQARRLTAANLALRGGGALVALAALAIWRPDLGVLGDAPFRQVINLHLAFNLALTLAAVPLAGATASLVTRLLPDASQDGAVRAASALDKVALNQPDRALAAVGREILRMAEIVTAMLTPAMRPYCTWDDRIAAEIGRAEDDVDRIHFDTKLFLAKLQQTGLTADQMRRASDLAAIANNLEDAADRISTDLLNLARRMHQEGLAFSADGWTDLAGFHDEVLSNAHLALDVLMSDDPDVARQLLEQKDLVRRRERELQRRHFDRLRTGSNTTIETSNIHQETIRALKHVNAGMSYIAYPIVEEAGELLSTRLARTETAETAGDVPSAGLGDPCR